MRLFLFEKFFKCFLTLADILAIVNKGALLAMPSSVFISGSLFYFIFVDVLELLLFVINSVQLSSF